MIDRDAVQDGLATSCEHQIRGIRADPGDEGDTDTSCHARGGGHQLGDCVLAPNAAHPLASLLGIACVHRDRIEQRRRRSAILQDPCRRAYANAQMRRMGSAALRECAERRLVVVLAGLRPEGAESAFCKV